MRDYFIKWYLLLCQYYMDLWHWFFSKINKLMIIYETDTRKNITLNYYLNYNLVKYQNSTFFVTVYNQHNTNYFTFTGDITDIDEISDQVVDTIPSRKNIILMNKDQPINFDLQILDNYHSNTKNLKSKSITNLKKITELMDLQCTHVKFIEKKPFKINVSDVNDLEINHLYE